jgi:hypothetical protein
MHHGGQTFTVLRFIAGFSKEAGSENAFSSTAGHTACFESTQMRADFAYWFGQKFDHIRLGPVSSIRIKIRSENTHIGSYGWSGESDGIRLL